MSKLNSALNRYGITDKGSIRLFMATMAEESGYGRDTLEKRTDFSSVSYTKSEMGAGYVQITHRGIHLAFLNSVGDNFKGADTASYIAENYAIEAVAWFWSSEAAKSTSAGSLNDYVVSYGDSKGVFPITQYFVNGYVTAEGFDSNLASIRKGGYFDTSNGKLNVNGNKYRLPVNWDKRDKAYDKAIKIFVN